MGWFPCAAALLGSPNAQGKPAQHIHLPLGGRTAPGKARSGRHDIAKTSHATTKDPAFRSKIPSTATKTWCSQKQKTELDVGFRSLGPGTFPCLHPQLTDHVVLMNYWIIKEGLLLVGEIPSGTDRRPFVPV